MKWNSIPRSVALLTGALVSVAVWSGCTKDSPQTPQPSTSAYNLNAPMGGFTSDDEQPAFGDESIAQLESEESAISDPLNDSLDRGGNIEGYALTILWGRFDRTPNGGLGDEGDSTDAMNWTGGLTATQGAILVRRTVAFERTDHVLPRRDQSLVEWVSQTQDGFDGLRVAVMRAMGSDGSTDSLYFHTPSYSRGFAFSELADLDLVVDVDQDGHQVRIQSMEITPNASVRGMIVGRWVHTAGAPMGSFAGRWVVPDGTSEGFVRGVFGRNDQGEQVFYGKWIDRTGRFQGFVNGDYQETDTHGRNGVSGSLNGVISSGTVESPTNIGRLRGKWAMGLSGRGVFDGAWCIGCP